MVTDISPIPRTRGVSHAILRYQAAIAVWFVSAVGAVVTFFFAQRPASWYDEGAGEKLTAVTAMCTVTAFVGAGAIALSVWALMGPKVVRVDVPDSATIANLTKALDDVRKVVHEVHAAHEGLHPQHEHDLARRTDPR